MRTKRHLKVPISKKNNDAEGFGLNEECNREGIEMNGEGIDILNKVIEGEILRKEDGNGRRTKEQIRSNEEIGTKSNVNAEDHVSSSHANGKCS
ncbi:hypothetical protein Tco_0534810 [Tanacetum coccineum]